MMIIFGCITSSQARESDESLAAIEARLSRLEQRIAVTENGLGQVSSYVSKGTEETRDTFRQIQAEVKRAADKFNSENISIRQRLVTAESQRKSSHNTYERLMAKCKDLESRLLEAESNMAKSAASLKQLAPSVNKNRTSPGQSVRRFNMQPGFRRLLANDSADFGRRYQKILSEQRSYSATRVRASTEASELKRHKSNASRGIMIRRIPRQRDVRRSHEAAGFYTIIDKEALIKSLKALFKH